LAFGEEAAVGEASFSKRSFFETAITAEYGGG